MLDIEQVEEWANKVQDISFKNIMLDIEPAKTPKFKPYNTYKTINFVVYKLIWRFFSRPPILQIFFILF